jgi:hypothetical protein
MAAGRFRNYRRLLIKTRTERRRQVPDSPNPPVWEQTFYDATLTFPRCVAASLVFAFDSRGKIAGIALAGTSGRLEQSRLFKLFNQPTGKGNMNWNRLWLAALALVAMLSAPANAQAQSWTQVGALTCTVDPSVGFILVGHQPMQCTYTPSLAPAPPEYYDGAINTVGIDIGVSAGSVLAWGVFAPTTGLPQGALAGEYVGASGDLGIGVGAGANILLGGSGRTVALQPLSLQGSLAFNVVLGVSSLKLRPATWR